jgi:hypothetical protein
MDDREYHILASMAGHGWCRPLDVGGHTRTHHSRTLAKMARKGWTERKQRSTTGRPRGSWMYRLTDAGLTAYYAEDARRFPEIYADKAKV